MYSFGPTHMAVQKQDDQHEHTFSSCVRIRDVVLRTCLGQWTIGRSGERGSGISVLPARHDDDNNVSAAHLSDDDRKLFLTKISSPCRSISTDISDSFLPPFSIVHYFRQVFKTTPRIDKELLYVGSSMTSCLCASISQSFSIYRDTLLDFLGSCRGH